MTIQCQICKRIKDDEGFRLPWPGELGMQIKDVYCPRCARETLVRIQNGEFARQATLRRQRQAAIG